VNGSIAIVTDTSACLPAEVVARRGLQVVPLQVVIGAQSFAESFDEGSEGATPEVVAEALREFRPVSTSRPSPAELLAAYEAAAAGGASSVVSIHLSGEMSGTFESAQLAAREASVPVLVVDSRQVGLATGFAVLAAADAVDAGASAEEAAALAEERAVASTSLFYVDTLEYLRRGGRVGAAAALLGGALAVKPLLCIQDGRVTMRERVRTSSRALARLEELAVEAAGSSPVAVGVAHLAAADRAEAFAAKRADRLADNLEGREPWCAEIGAALGAHVGPGMVAVCVSPRATT
jgi:DegV family protein with EDD domain